MPEHFIPMPSPYFGDQVYAEISAERQRAHAKHGANSMESKPVGAFIRYTILAEEVGEIAKEFNEAEARGGQETLDLERLRAECVQVAAMAAAWADRLAFTIRERAVDDAPAEASEPAKPSHPVIPKDEQRPLGWLFRSKS